MCFRPQIRATLGEATANAPEPVGQAEQGTARLDLHASMACAFQMAILLTPNALTAMEATDQEAMEVVAAAMAAGEVVVVMMAAGEVMVAMVEAAEVVVVDALLVRRGHLSPPARARWK